jgi:ATP-dependent RNA helicase DDX24/MAK5
LKLFIINYKEQEGSLLIASDVAARGLDIPGVMHVIHYQVPRSTQIYVHRSGRTARSNNQGLSVTLVSPNEMNLYKNVLKSFNNGNKID